MASAVISMRSRSWRLQCVLDRRAGLLRAIQQHAGDRAKHNRQRQLNPDGHEDDRVRRADKPVGDALVVEVHRKQRRHRWRPPQDVARRSGNRGDRRGDAQQRQQRGAIDHFHMATASTTFRSNTAAKFRTIDASASCDRDAPPRRAREGRHSAALDAARHDEPEEIEIGRHVERESMARNPARDAHANRTYLIGSKPRAREAPACALPSRPKSRGRCGS